MSRKRDAARLALSTGIGEVNGQLEQGSDHLRIVQELASLSGEELGCGTVRRGLACSGY